MPQPGDVLKTGHWTYGGKIRCKVEIQFSKMRPGSGDHEDPPESRDDQAGDWFVLSHSSPTDPDQCPPNWTSAPGYPTPQQAITQAEATLRDCGLE